MGQMGLSGLPSACWSRFFAGVLVFKQQLRVRTRELTAELALRRKTEADLRESDERWQFALEGSGDGVWDWDVNTGRVHFSRQWKAMLGFEEDEIGDTFDEWDSRVHPDDRAQAHADLERHIAGKVPYYQNEHRLRCKDGTFKWILDRGQGDGVGPGRQTPAGDRHPLRHHRAQGR